MDAKIKGSKNTKGREKYKQYYANGENAVKVRARVKRYNDSVQGALVRAQYRERNKLRIREYMKNYFRDRRARAKKLGLCANCLKSKEPNGTILCDKCAENMRKNSETQRLKKMSGRKPKLQPMDRETLAEIPTSYTKKKEKAAAELWQSSKIRKSL